MGTGSTVTPGEIQKMSAGTGVTHSEFNHSKIDPVHFLQIWILPERKGIAPNYEQKSVDRTAMQGKLRLIASKDPSEGAVKIHQDVNLYATTPGDGAVVTLELKPDRHAWVQMARGIASLNGLELEPGDGAAMSGETVVTIEGIQNAEVLVFDLG
jgi:redox-sensitive bicupin YhaK (pirin superfamily)